MFQYALCSLLSTWEIDERDLFGFFIGELKENFLKIRVCPGSTETH